MSIKEVRVSASEIGQAVYQMSMRLKEGDRAGKGPSKVAQAEIERLEQLRRESLMEEGRKKHEQYTEAMLNSMEQENPSLFSSIMRFLRKMLGLS